MTTSRFCTYCGTPGQDEKFCTGCGQPLPAGNDESAAAATTEPAASSTAASAMSSAGAATAVRASSEAVLGHRLESPGLPPRPSPSGRYAYAGAPPAPLGSRIPWLAIIASSLMIIVVAAVAAVVLITAGGKPAVRVNRLAAQKVQLTNTLLASRQLYAAAQQPSYSALLPAGWHQVATKNASLTAGIAVQSPVDGGATITVGQITKPATSLRAQAALVIHAASSQPSFAQQASSATTLAGGRRAWVIAYNAAGQSTAVYLMRSCANTYAVAATVPPSRVSLLRTRIEIVASTLQGNC
jgi:hypothetical protein